MLFWDWKYVLEMRDLGEVCENEDRNVDLEILNTS